MKKASETITFVATLLFMATTALACGGDGSSEEAQAPSTQEVITETATTTPEIQASAGSYVPSDNDYDQD